LTYSREATDEPFWFSVLHDLSIDISRVTPSASAMRVRWILLEGPFELVEAFLILVELGFQLTQLCELCGLIVLRRRVWLSFILRSPELRSSY